MSFLTIFLAALIAVGFTGWGIIGKYTHISGGWVGTIVMGITTIIVAFTSIRQISGVFPSGKALMLLIIAGVANGVAVSLYVDKVTDPAIPTAIFMVLVSVLMAVSAPCLDWAFNGNVPNISHAIGYTFAVGAIYFLGK